MGIFSDFLFDGFTEDQIAFYSPGTLYEVMSPLGEKTRGEDKRLKVKDLLSFWSQSREALQRDGRRVPVYALEFHALNDKRDAKNGCGAYVYVPDEAISVENVLKSTFSEPIEIYDDEDPTKILSAVYCNEYGRPNNENLTVWELGLAKENYYPLRVWDNKMSADPLISLFGLFDTLKPGEFCGMSLVLVAPHSDWSIAGRMKWKSMRTEDFQAELSFAETMSRKFRGEKMPWEEAAESLTGKNKQLDFYEQGELDSIEAKINPNLGKAFQCSLRIYASSPDIAQKMAGILIQLTAGDDRSQNQLCVINKEARLDDLALRRECDEPFILYDAEIATLWHVPDDSTPCDTLHKPLPAATRPPDGMVEVEMGGPGDINYILAMVASGGMK